MNKEKTYLGHLLLILAACTLSLLSCAQNTTEEFPTEKPIPVESLYGQLSVDGHQLVNEKGKPVVLRGVSFGWHMWWSRFWNKSTVSHLVDDWKCNVVRAAMGVSLSYNNSYLQNPNFGIDCVTKVVDAAIEKGIYVIVDFHTHDICLDEATIFFTQIATKYKDYPNIIYEIFNEPLDTHTWKEVKEYSETIINVIRKIDPDNLILVGSPYWDQALHLVANDPIQNQSNIMYTMHFYAASHKKSLRDRCDAAIAKGIPIFVSECAGMEATGDGTIDYEEWNNWKNWMEAANISWLAWSIADKNETCSMIKDTTSPITAWGEKDLKEWGREVRKTLREKNTH